MTKWTIEADNATALRKEQRAAYQETHKDPPPPPSPGLGFLSVALCLGFFESEFDSKSPILSLPLEVSRSAPQGVMEHV